MADVPPVSDDELIRTDWGNTVSAEVNNSVKKTGAQTMAGPLTVNGQINANNQIVISDAAPTAVSHATRKDYCDQKVLASGDVMTGNLIAPVVLVNTPQSVAANALVRRDFITSGFTMSGNLIVPSVRVNEAQDTAANALTRKDYVDALIAALDARLDALEA